MQNNNSLTKFKITRKKNNFNNFMNMVIARLTVAHLDPQNFHPLQNQNLH